MSAEARASMRRTLRAMPGGQRRSPHKPGRRPHTRSPYWTIRAALLRRAEEQMTGKRKRRWFRRTAQAVLHPVAAMRRQETSSRAAFKRDQRQRMRSQR